MYTGAAGIRTLLACGMSIGWIMVMSWRTDLDARVLMKVVSLLAPSAGHVRYAGQAVGWAQHTDLLVQVFETTQGDYCL